MEQLRSAKNIAWLATAVLALAACSGNGSNGGPAATAGAPPPPAPAHRRPTSLFLQYTDRPPLYGFADLHNHQFAHRAYGDNDLIFGEPSGPPDQALRKCALAPVGAVHLPGDAMERYHPLRCAAYAGHRSGGWPTFEGWPRWDTFTHQMNHETWLRRSHIGGQRLMVMLAVNSESACKQLPGSQPAPGRTCEDMENVDVQLRAAKAFEEKIDRDFGWDGSGTTCDVATRDCDAVYHGERPGWYRIVYSAEQARDAIAHGKLAVVLGIEVADLFGCVRKGGCTKQSITAEVKRLQRIGVRHVFPVHQTINAFGGPAIFTNAQCQDLPGVPCPLQVGAIRKCRGDGYLYERRWHGLGNPVCGASTGSVHCSDTGLTGLGDELVKTLMDHHMFVDVDHMSVYARQDAMAIAEQRTAGVYPLVSGHTDFFDMSAGEGKSEAALKAEEINRLYLTGGMVAPIIIQGGPETPCAPGSTAAACREPLIQHTCTKDVEWSSSAEWARAFQYAKNQFPGAAPRVAIGSDFNGMAHLPRPRFGADGCYDLAADGDRVGRVDYPFAVPVPVAASPTAPTCTADDGCACLTPEGTLPRCRFGERTFDVNTDGLPHVGLLPDFFEDARVQFAARFRELGHPADQASALATAELAPMFRSAEAYVLLWERIDGVQLRAPGDAFEDNDTLATATSLAAVDGAADLTLHTPDDVDHYTVTVPACATLKLVLTHDPATGAPDVEVLDAKGVRVKVTWATFDDRVEATIARASGAYLIRVGHTWTTTCGLNGCQPQFTEFTGTYHLAVSTTADPSAGSEVCDGQDNDCNGLVDDCAATDPACVDSDRDGRANCVDEDDDHDCVLDTQDNCPLVSNANFLCPQADANHPCAHCVMPVPVGQVKVIQRWLEVCAARPVKPICRTSGCPLEDVFGLGGAVQVRTLRGLLADPRSFAMNDGGRRTLEGALGTMRFEGNRVVLPALGPGFGSIMEVECATGASAAGAAAAISMLEAMRRRCLLDARAYVLAGRCQEDVCNP